MATIIFICFLGYTLLLFGINWLTAKQGSNDTFFRANKKSPWPIVAYGMIGANISGVTFMSVPGYVQSSQFTYFAFILGNVLGYVAIALILLPLYYKLDLTSIYAYLEKRFGFWSRHCGSFFFFISKLMGAAVRMYLVTFVLYEFVFKHWGIPFWIPAFIFTVIMLLYTIKGGLRTIVWTDTLQTTFLLLAAGFTIYFILKDTGFSLWELLRESSEAGHTKIVETDWKAGSFFWKQIVSGMFLTIAMNGLDQDMMQKSLSCKNLRSAQKNAFTLSLSLVLVNLLFLVLGATLLHYASHVSFALPEKADKIFPVIAFDLSTVTIVLFIIGLLAAGYSSADSALTALTTAICFDFLGFDRDKKSTQTTVKNSFTKLSIIGLVCVLLAVIISSGIIIHPVWKTLLPVILFAGVLSFIFFGLTISTEKNIPDENKVKVRKIVHIICSILFFSIIVAFEPFHTDSLIKTVYDIASLTYGPLLGLFCFGLFTKWQIKEEYVPFIAIASPVICYILKLYSEEFFNGYKFGFELLLVNGLLTFIGLCFCIRNTRKNSL